MKLIAALPSPFARKIRILLAEKNLPFDLVLDNPWVPETQVGLSNPLGQVPCLVLEDGYAIYDSHVIAEYLETLVPSHMPVEPKARIETLKWIALTDGLLDAGIKIRMEQMRPEHLQNPPWIERQMIKINRGLKVMDQRLAQYEWCTNDAYSLADVGLVCLVGFLDFRLPDFNWRESYPNIDRLAQQLNAQPIYQSTLPWIE